MTATDLVLPCARIGCRDRATASFAFDASSGLVWLDPLTAPNQGAGLLCDRHADRLTPPRGWNLQDRRGPAPHLWAERPVPATIPRAVARRERAPRSRPCTATTTVTALPFDGNVLADPSSPTDVSLERVLEARTPLLARAFEAARYPRRRDETADS
jgi:hypothetical protein